VTFQLLAFCIFNVLNGKTMLFVDFERTLMLEKRNFIKKHFSSLLPSKGFSGGS